MIENLSKKIFEVSYREGDFKLRSGQRSTTYFDKYQFESRPELLKQIVEAWTQKGLPQFDVLAGLELGGVPLATALGLQTQKPITFVRKKPKDYGTCLISEGASIAKKRVLVIEDVVTTGGQVFESVAELGQAGAEISDVLCVIDRGTNTNELFAQKSLKLHALFTMEQLMLNKI